MNSLLFAHIHHIGGVALVLLIIAAMLIIAICFLGKELQK